MTWLHPGAPLSRALCAIVSLGTIFGLAPDARAACTPGDTTPVVAAGTSASELIQGCDGPDDLSGAGGHDYLRGYGGDDALKGDAGDDILRGGPGKDSFFGGADRDRVSFYEFQATQGAIANIATQAIANDGFGNSETMNSIEDLGAGTRFADVFTGDGNANRIIGVGAGDKAYGLGGADHFQIDDAAGADIAGGADTDCACFFTQMRLVDDGFGGAAVQTTTNGVSVDLALKRILNDGWGGAGDLKSIENLNGSLGADTLLGSSAANEISGADGDDTIDGRGGADRLTGGAGADTLTGGTSADVFVYASAADSTASATDFVKFRKGHSDRIDLSAIDANPGSSADDAFAFVAAQNAASVPQSVTWWKDSANQRTLVQADTGAGVLTIYLEGLVNLTAAQFKL